jgi:hypothetical protein
MLEALERIGEPLSAIEMVDVLDGYLTMWEAKYHLQVLRACGVIEFASTERAGEADDEFRQRYKLKTAADDND